MDILKQDKEGSTFDRLIFEKKSYLDEFASHGESSRGSSSWKYMRRKLWFNKETVMLILSGKSTAL